MDYNEPIALIRLLNSAKESKLSSRYGLSCRTVSIKQLLTNCAINAEKYSDRSSDIRNSKVRIFFSIDQTRALLRGSHPGGGDKK